MRLRPLVCLAPFLLVLLAVLGCKGAPPTVPDVVAGPDTVYVQASARFQLATTAPGDREVRFVCDWGDSTDTTVAFRSGDTNELRHQWSAAGTFDLRFRAVLDGEENRTSGWTEPTRVNVLANGIPSVPEFTTPVRAVPNGIALFHATATDPDGDSVSYVFDFGDAVGIWTTLVASGETGLDSHRYGKMDTFLVRCRARDKKGSESDWSEPETLPAGQTGAVRWWRQIPGVIAIGSVGPVVRSGNRELVYIYVPGYPNTISSVDVATGEVVSTGVIPDSGKLRAGLTYCDRTGHLIASSSRGLRAFTQSLYPVWRWPESDSVTPAEGTVVDEDLVYTCIGDSIYCIRDAGAIAERVGSACMPHIEGLPAIDGSGCVVAACSDGFLYRFQPQLAALDWRRSLSPPGANPAIGADGRIYCATRDTVLFCIGPDSSLVWWTPAADRNYQPSVADSAIFAGTDDGWLYSINPADGSINWQVQPDQHSFLDGLFVLYNGLVLCPTMNGVLYCLDPADGSVVWSCDMEAYGPPRDDRDAVDANIASNGDVLMAEGNVLYCIAGYPDGTLDTDAPWPKWQHDAHNTGKTRAR